MPRVTRLRLCRYATVCCNGNMSKAQNVLRRQQQEQVSFERNTIWKDMVGQERRAATLHVQVRVSQVTLPVVGHGLKGG